MTETFPLAAPPLGPKPILDEDTTPFWTGDAEGRLLITRCQACGTYLHPPAPVCWVCRSMDVRPEPVSGRATLVSFTVNHQAWAPGMQTPFVIGLVALVEQPSVRLTTNIVETPLERIVIGMALNVQFARHGDIWMPLFAEADR